MELGVNIDEEPPLPAVVEEEPEEEPSAAVEASSEPETPPPEPEVKTVPRERRRSLLGMIDINSAMWLGWNSMPEHVQRSVSAPPPNAVGSDARVVRVGGYWRAASANNRRRRQSKSRNGFPLRRGQKDEEEVQECNPRYSVVNVQCFGENVNHAVVTVKGSHTFYPGDVITFEHLALDDASLVHMTNGQRTVYAIPVPLDADQHAINWQEVWKMSPFLDDEHSVFAVSFGSPDAACGVYPNPGAIVRRSANPSLPFCQP